MQSTFDIIFAMRKHFTPSRKYDRFARCKHKPQHPRAAYPAFAQGSSTFLARTKHTMPNISHLAGLKQPLEDIIRFIHVYR